MNKWLLAFAALIAVACSTNVGMYDYDRHAVHIGYVNSDGGLCSGTNLGGGYVLTASHCVRRGPATISVDSHPVESVPYLSWSLDVAVLKVPELEHDDPATINCKYQPIGTKTYGVGDPAEFRSIVSPGQVMTKIVPVSRWAYAQLNAMTAAPGFSGGGIFNKENNLVAILVGGITQWGGMAVTVPTVAFCSEMEEAGIIFNNGDFLDNQQSTPN